MNWFENVITGLGAWLEKTLAWLASLLTGWDVDAVPVWFSTLVKIILILVPLIFGPAGLFALTTWVERKVLARIANRLGPNRVGPFGLLQPVADGLKMLTKED